MSKRKKNKKASPVSAELLAIMDLFATWITFCSRMKGRPILCVVDTDTPFGPCGHLLANAPAEEYPVLAKKLREFADAIDEGKPIRPLIDPEQN